MAFEANAFLRLPSASLQFAATDSGLREGGAKTGGLRGPIDALHHTVLRSGPQVPKPERHPPLHTFKAALTL